MILSLLLTTGAAAAQQPRQFDEYPASTSRPAKLSMPSIVTPDQKRFRTELRQAITKGYDVVEGGTEHERAGPNFAGAIVLVQWGCGSNCMQAAFIDTRDGAVFYPPKVPGQEFTSPFDLPTGSADMRTLKFRTDSRLLGIPNIGDGKTYFYVLNGHTWKFAGSAAVPDAFLVIPPERK